MLSSGSGLPMPALIPTAGFSHESALYLSQSLKSWGHWYVFNFLLLWIQEGLLIIFSIRSALYLFLWGIGDVQACYMWIQKSEFQIDFRFFEVFGKAFLG